jgi:hypothetical protein
VTDGDAGAEGDPETEDGAERGADSEIQNDPETASSAKPNATDAPRRVAKRELGVELIEHLEADELPLSAVIDRVETITTSPSLTREILDTAERRGLIDRENGQIRVRRGGSFVRFEQQVVARDGEFTCRRCGAGLSTGHFISFETGELGPFGSDCIRKVVGRDE